MKILIYAHIFPPSKGGVQFSNLEIIKGLHACGNEIRVIACHNKGIWKFVKKLPFDVEILPKWHFTTMSSIGDNGMLNWFFLPWYMVVFKRSINAFSPDIILITDETANTFWGIWAHRVTVPYVSYCSVPHIATWLTNSTLERINSIRKIRLHLLSRCLINSYLNAEYLISVSNSTREKLCKAIPQRKERMPIIPRSVDDLFFRAPVDRSVIQRNQSRYGINNDNFVLMSVSRLSLRKGIDDTMEAIAGLPQDLSKKVKYFIIGDGISKKHLQAMAQKLGIDQHTYFTGDIPHTELVSFYDMCDLFILPSRRGTSESFGRVFVEAAARSKSSLGVNQGGMIDIIRDGETGYLVAPGDVETIREKIEFLMMNRGINQKMGRKARTNAERKYSSRSISKEFESILNLALR